MNCRFRGRKTTIFALILFEKAFRTENAQFYMKLISFLKNLLMVYLLPTLVERNLDICASLNQCKKMKAEPSQLIPQKIT